MERARGSVPEERPLRLFVAVDVPEHLKDALAGTVAPYRARIPGARWTHLSTWHVTLKFLGWVWPRLEEGVRAAVAGVAAAAAPFDARLTEIGVFPNPNRARVVWAGLADAPAGRFAEVVRELDEALAESFEPEQRDYRPHLTLARLGTPRRVDEFARGLVGTDVTSEPFPVTALVLYRSHLSPRGATYEPMLRAPLGGDA